MLRLGMVTEKAEVGVALLLAAAAGFTDAVAYLSLGVFVANFTGAVVLLGAAMAGATHRVMWPNAAALAAFAAGIVAGRALRLLDGRPFVPIAAACLLLLAGAFLPDFRGGLILLLAASMGVQNSALRHFDGVSLNTSFITGDMQTLGQSVVEAALRGPRSDNSGRKIAVVSATIVVYGASAMLGGFALRHLGRPLLVPAALQFAATVAAGLGCRRE